MARDAAGVPKLQSQCMWQVLPEAATGCKADVSAPDIGPIVKAALCVCEVSGKACSPESWGSSREQATCDRAGLPLKLSFVVSKLQSSLSPVTCWQSCLQ